MWSKRSKCRSLGSWVNSSLSPSSCDNTVRVESMVRSGSANDDATNHMLSSNNMMSLNSDEDKVNNTNNLNEQDTANYPMSSTSVENGGVEHVLSTAQNSWICQPYKIEQLERELYSNSPGPGRRAAVIETLQQGESKTCCLRVKMHLSCEHKSNPKNDASVLRGDAFGEKNKSDPTNDVILPRYWCCRNFVLHSVVIITHSLSLYYWCYNVLP